MIFFFVVLNFINALTYPPAFLLEQSIKQKKSLQSVRIISDVTYKGLSFKETLLFKAPSSYRIVIEKETEAILFIREADECIAISKSKSLGIKCSNYLNSIPYNIYFNTGSYFRFIKNFGVNFVASDNEIKLDKETGAIIKPGNIVLLKLEDKAFYAVGVSEAELLPFYEEARTNQINKVSDYVINKIMFLKPQVWFEQSSLLPSRIFGINNGKKLEVLLKFYTVDFDNLSYPKILEILEDKAPILSYKTTEYNSKIKISDNIFKLSTYKEKFKDQEKNPLSENKTLLLNYLRDYR